MNNDYSLFHNLRSFTSSSETRSGSCGSSGLQLARLIFRSVPLPTVPLNFLSCGFPKNAPPLTYTARVLSRSTPERVFLRLCAAKHKAPSVHVVPPDFDGLLRELRCRFVSSCSQPWGSVCFCRGLLHHCVSTMVGPPRLPQARTSHPSKLFPHR